MTSELPSYRAAIIGTGRIANTYDDEVRDRYDYSHYQGENRHVGLYLTLPVNHAEAYALTPGYELVAAANRSEEKLRAFGERRGVQALYTDYHTMLRQEAPDVVSICTQSPDKAAATIAAAEAGVKAVIVEKAMATSMAEADAMIAACQANGVLLVVNHPYRFSPLARQTKALIDAGAIGELTGITEFGSSGMIHVGTHIFDLMRYWAGDAVEVAARVPGYAPDQDLPAVGTVHFANGVIGFFDHTHREQIRLEVRGRKGVISLSSMLNDGWLCHFEPYSALHSGGPYPNRVRLEPIEGEPHTMSVTQRLLSDLHDTLTHGAPFVSLGTDGAAALEMGLACYASHCAGGPVTLPLSDRAFRVHNR